LIVGLDVVDLVHAREFVRERSVCADGDELRLYNNRLGELLLVSR
jgi:hypothetical protein